MLKYLYLLAQKHHVLFINACIAILICCFTPVLIRGVSDVWNGIWSGMMEWNNGTDACVTA